MLMSATVSPEIAALREKVENQGKEISELRGGLQQIDKIVSATTRQSIWQLIALVISLSAAIIGGLAYQTNMIDKRIELLERNEATRYEALEKRIDQVEKNMNTRIEQSEKNITARFEDLKQEVRSQRR
jgi:archaellum component FlaC